MKNLVSAKPSSGKVRRRNSEWRWGVKQSDGKVMSTLFSLEGRTAFITGGSTGIGTMIARGFL